MDCLLELDGESYVINDDIGLWVKFDVKKVLPTADRPHGLRYSLTLHDRSNRRLIGFDNAHAIEYDKQAYNKPMRTFDHWHRDYKNRAYPYHFTSAKKLLEDFWAEVDEIYNILEGKNNDK